jgi:hypothetical protein
MENTIQKYAKRLAVLKENRASTVDFNTDAENEQYDRLIEQVAEFIRDLSQLNLPVVTVRYLLEVTTDKGNYLEQRIVNEREDADKWLKFLNEEYKGYKITCLEINAR